MSTAHLLRPRSGTLWPIISLAAAQRAARLQRLVERLVGPLAERRTGNDRRHGRRIRSGRRATD